MYLIFDTETTGLPNNYNAPQTDFENWPRLVQLAWQRHDEKGNLIDVKNFIVKPEGFTIPYNSEKIHGISTQRAIDDGVDLDFVLKEFAKDIEESKFIVGHNVEFDINIVGCEFLRKELANKLNETDSICTKLASVDFCQIPGGRGRFKWPTLTELHYKLFDEGFDEAHNAAADVEATTRCFLELIRVGVLGEKKLKTTKEVILAFKENNPNQIKAVGLNVQPYKDSSSVESKSHEEEVVEVISEVKDIKDVNFTHLHVHSQFSILDGAADIKRIVSKAKKDNMKALAITDHGNMFGAKLLHKTATKEGIKPILGCEVYVARRGMHVKENKTDASGEHLILLAKNKEGYHNLIKMVSYSWLEGQYYKPRIDKDLLRKYHHGIIALSACLGGEISQKIMNSSIEEAEKAALEYKEIFGEDYYLELQRHRTGNPEKDRKVYDDQVFVNKGLVKLSSKLDIKIVATNDVHFVDSDDAGAHDRLICLSTGKDLDDPNRMHYTEQEWFKTQREMKDLFADLPEAIITTNEIEQKIEAYDLDSAPIMPDFELPEGFENEDDYLRHITFEGAKIRYEDLNDEVVERLDFELNTIKKMGFPGYFLIVWDFLVAARDMGVSVGPGRGSAAGSVVAYCLKITDIDPLKYNLLFERFLNPDRVSMPDIDIDFDDDGRGRVMEWVVNKYGKTRVAHIVTFGTMAAKSSIRDVARVQRLPLSESDRLAKLVPERPGTTLKDAFDEVPELREAKNSNDPEIASVLQYAEILEGSVRNTGTHACGVIIGKDDLENYIPISTAKDSELTYVTQYDGKHVEDVGLLKMDFLGLKTLSIIKDAIKNIKLSRDIDIDIDKIPLDDVKTYELYSNGETTGLFQFESDGMKKYLKELKPTRFEDLIAMNALYRPGPMEYIPQFVKRKHGIEKIEYDFPVMEEQLKETYGITVYQEQVMLLSRAMAGFTRGESDSLRKAMGKKIKSMMDELKVKFVEGCAKNGLEEKGVLKVWSDWEAFAKYAFNKSHATCYSYVSYQTGYLKAHYPAEFMAAVLSRNLNDIKKITFFMDECKRMGMKVLGPDVNESHSRFTVNKKGDIRFGLAAIKGVGGAAVNNIIEEREKNGNYNDIYDFVERVSLQSVNKSSVEALAYAGGFDSFTDIQRSQYFSYNENEPTFIETLARYGNKFQLDKQNAQQSLFGGGDAIEIATPVLPKAEDWSKLFLLNKEKDHIGIYLSAHPLDTYRLEIESLCNTRMTEFENLETLANRDIVLAGIVSNVRKGRTKKDKPYAIITIEDFTGSYQMAFFSKDYIDFGNYLEAGLSLMIKGKVQPKRYDKTENEFKIKTISLLAEARETMIKKITIKVPLEAIDDRLIKEFETITEANKGNANLNFLIYNPEDKVWVEMFSRTHRVNISEEMLQYLEKKSEIEYKIS